MANLAMFRDLIQAQEGVPIVMDLWFTEGHECGTAGCLVGNWAMHGQHCPVHYGKDADGEYQFRRGGYTGVDVRPPAERSLGIGRRIFQFLFVAHWRPAHNLGKAPEAQSLSDAEARKRLLKVYRYYERKQALLDANEQWRAMPKRQRQQHWNEREVSLALAK